MHGATMKKNLELRDLRLLRGVVEVFIILGHISTWSRYLKFIFPIFDSTRTVLSYQARKKTIRVGLFASVVWPQLYVGLTVKRINAYPIK
jgi:hypothetical protein